MSLIGRAVQSMERVFPRSTAYAHCDIPCGIYDPHQAQIAALTTIRMNQLIGDLPPNPSPQEQAKLERYIAVKEEHAELCKHELRVLWGDYFKPQHVEQYPDIHEKFWKAMQGASKVKQEVDMDAAQQLLTATQEIAEIFWQTKGVTPRRQPSNQGAVGGELVYPSA